MLRTEHTIPVGRALYLEDLFSSQERLVLLVDPTGNNCKRFGNVWEFKVLALASFLFPHLVFIESLNLII